MSNSLIKTNTDLAFRLADDAHAASGTASQAMAFVLLSLYADYRTQGGMRIPGKNGEASQTMPLPTWDALRKGGETKTLFVAAVKHSLDVTLASPDKDASFKQRAAIADSNGREKRHMNLIGRSIELAAALTARGVGLDAYGKAKINGKEYPVWRVPVSMLAMPGWQLLGDEANNPGILRPLDGKSILAQAKNDKGEWRPVQNAVASVDQFKRATFGPKAPTVKGADANKTEVGSVLLSNGKTVPSDFQKLILEAGRLIREVSNDGDGVANLSAFDKPVRDALAGIAAFYTDALEAQQKAKEAKVAAMKAEADRVKAAKEAAKATNAEAAKAQRAAELAEAKAAKVAAAEAARAALAKAEAEGLPITQAMRDDVARAEAAAGMADA